MLYIKRKIDHTLVVMVSTEKRELLWLRILKNVLKIFMEIIKLRKWVLYIYLFISFYQLWRGGIGGNNISSESQGSRFNPYQH